MTNPTKQPAAPDVTPTPRTDAAPKAAYRDAMFCELVSADFARTLERESDRLREENASLRAKMELMTLSNISGLPVSQAAEIARLREVLARVAISQAMQGDLTTLSRVNAELSPEKRK